MTPPPSWYQPRCVPRRAGSWACPATGRANSDGVRLPRAPCGRTRLQSSLHASVTARASSSDRNQCWFKYSSVRHEVHAPALIGLPGRRTCLANLHALASTWLSPPDSKAFFTVRPVDELLVHDPPFTAQEHRKILIPVVDPTCRQVPQSNTKLGPLVTPALGAEAPPSEPEHPAGPTFRQPTRDLH